MNTNIPLMGVTPDFMATIDNSNIARQRQNDFNRANALTSYVQQNGPGIMRGDANALAGYARFNPEAAQGVIANNLGIEATRQDMAATAQRMRILNEEQARAAEAHAAEMSSAERAALFQQSQQTIGQLATARNAEEWDAMAPPELRGGFAQREQLFASVMDFNDILARQDQLQAPSQQYQAVGGNIWDFGDGTSPPTLLPGQGQETVVYGPDGQPVYSQGTPGTAQRFTEGQSKDNVYATRARGALEVLNAQGPDGSFLADELSSFGQRLAGSDPTGLARGAFQSDNFQVMQQAGNEFLQAILRKDTGAAITADEQALYGQTYLPQPGDSAAQLAAKRDARIRALAAIEAGMNPAQIVARDQALINAARESGTPPPPPPPPAVNANGPAPTGQITAETIRTMTPMALAEYIATTPIESIPDDVLTAIMERPQ